MDWEAAWLVDEVILVDNPDEEILALNDFDPAREMIVDKNFFSSEVRAGEPHEEDFIHLVSYAPNRLVYEFSCREDRWAVFSEVYYPWGWQALINKQPVEHFRTNFVLRGMLLPKGEHKLEFRFQPDSYHIGGWVSRIASGILLSLTALVLILGFLHEKRKVSGGQGF